MLIESLNKKLSKRYGSRRGAVLTYWYRTRFVTGGYRRYRQIDWSSVERLVFVCKGNICRSAYAEAVARSLGVASVSCGIKTVAGASADQDAIKAGASKGIDLAGHSTTPIQILDYSPKDLFVAMEPWQADYLKDAMKVSNACTLLGLWGSPASPYIHDPFGLSPFYFDNCFAYIAESVNEIARKVGAY